MKIRIFFCIPHFWVPGVHAAEYTALHLRLNTTCCCDSFVSRNTSSVWQELWNLHNKIQNTKFSEPQHIWRVFNPFILICNMYWNYSIFCLYFIYKIYRRSNECPYISNVKNKYKITMKFLFVMGMLCITDYRANKYFSFLLSSLNYNSIQHICFNCI